MATSYQVGDRISYDGAVCTTRYIGEVKGTSGSWLGVEWDDPARGKHNGNHKGVQYFKCLSTSATAASFIRPTRPAEPPVSFVEAVREKYAAEAREGFFPAKEIVISGKVAEEIGFDKIRRQQGQLRDLKVVILDGLRVGYATETGKGVGKEERERLGDVIKEVCPAIVELDLSRNLFVDLGVVVDICRELGGLRSLKLNGNRFQNVLTGPGLKGAEEAFAGVKELALNETLLSWEEIAHIASKFPDLTSLYASGNQLSAIPPSLSTSTTPGRFGKNLAVVNLEYNEFKTLESLFPLATLPLRTLHLKGNAISAISSSDIDEDKKKIFPSSLHYIDLSYNSISSWSLIDALPSIFQGMTSLRLSHNPIYEHPSDTSTSTDTTTTTAAAAAASATDEAHMLTIARTPTLTALNFAAISPQDRSNAEMFYLSRIAKEMALVSPEEEAEAAGRYPRWEDLCKVYGTPDIVRRVEVSEGLLEGRLVRVGFSYHCRDKEVMEEREERRQEREGKKRNMTEKQKESAQVKVVEREARIPRSYDLYAVQGIAGRLFGISPLRVRLVWETGEWDPVGDVGDITPGGGAGGQGDDDAGGDGGVKQGAPIDVDSDSSEEEVLEAIMERQGAGMGEMPEAGAGGGGKKVGRWVKREVELSQGPRMFGFVVDGLEVRIRVEARDM